MKKILALTLAVLMLASLLVACGTSNNSPSTTNAPETTTAPASTKSYQFYGSYGEEGSDSSFASFLNAAFLLELNADGTAVCDKYNYATYDASDVATNSAYQQSYLSGTWKEVEKDGVPCLQIKLAYIDADNNESSAQTCYAYDVAGTYTFEMTFPVVPGQAFTRVVAMEGTETKKFADDNAFIQAYKQEFVAPEHVGTFADAEHDGTAYLQADGTMLVYSGYDKILDGKWMKTADGVSISINGEAVEVTVEGTKASFKYDHAVYGDYVINYVFACEDISALPTAEVAADAPYTATVNMGGNETSAELVLVDDTTATLKVFTSFNCTYVKVGTAVVLTCTDKLEGYGTQIWPNINHAYILNEDHSMVGVKNVYEAGQLVLIALDDTNMKVVFPQYSMEREGFTYVIDGANMTITAPGEDVLGAFGQIWSAMGGANWTIDGNTATKAAE